MIKQKVRNRVFKTKTVRYHFCFPLELDQLMASSPTGKLLYCKGVEGVGD